MKDIYEQYDTIWRSWEKEKTKDVALDCPQSESGNVVFSVFYTLTYSNKIVLARNSYGK